MGTHVYRSKVLFLGLFDLGTEIFGFTSMEEANASKKLILQKTVRPWARPFCKVRIERICSITEKLNKAIK